jgi:hypothetical protein
VSASLGLKSLAGLFYPITYTEGVNMSRSCLLQIVLLVVALAVSVGAFFQLYPVYANVDAQLDRAQVSSSISMMAENLEKVRAEMERRGITQGHAALVFKTPQNDVGLDYQAVTALRDRARNLSDADPTSVEYNVALDDMRGTVREIEIEAYYHAAIRNPMAWISLILWIILVIWAIVEAIKV